MPPSGGWPPPQQPNPPFNQGQPYGQPGYPPQQPPPGWPQQTPPPKQNGSLKWLLIGVAVLLVIGITVGATLLFTRDGGAGSTSPTSNSTSDIASANDTGPVSVITTEPTCNAFVGINNSLADIQAKGWGAQRSTLGPRQSWTPDQLAQVELVTKATQNAADQMAPLARQTPNRVVARLYEQFISYGRAYADSINDYTPADNGLASANVNASSALVGICNAITYGSAARSVALDPVKPPSTDKPADISSPQRFITDKDAACTSFQQLSDQFDVEAAEWQRMDSSIPANQWTPEQRATQAAALPAMSNWADGMEKVGRESNNPTLEDFAATAAVYLRAYIAVGDNYTATDSWLSYVSLKLNQVVLGACRAVSG